MIDLHAHILPGLDDGATDLAESLAMARLACADGVRTIVATPHNHDWKPGIGRLDILERVAHLQSALDAAGISMKCVPGVEAYLTPNITEQVESGQAFCLGGSRYILVELPLELYPSYVEQAIFELQIKGLAPILAHPERNAVLAREPRRLYQLVERGLLTQLTAASLVGGFGPQVQDAASLFLKHNLAHIIASDAHGVEGRSPVLSAAVAAAAAVVGQARATAMVTTVPESILAGERLAVEPPLALASNRKGWFWKK